MAINFNGTVLIQPQARTTVNTSALTPAPATPPQPHTLVLIGPANQGPNALTAITSLRDIATTLGTDSDLANAAALALNPGLGVTANPLKVWNVNPTTQATGTMANGSGAAQITLTTTRWGQAANLIKWNVVAGTSSGYTVTVADDYSGQSVSLQNLALNVFSLAYTGTAYTGVTATITDSTLTVSGTASGATSPTTIFTVSFATYPTVQQVVNQINQQSGFQATLLDPNPNDPSSAFFDNVSNVAISSTATTFTANITAVVRALNAAVQPWVTAQRDANASTLATTGAWVYASGGTTGTATTTDWQNAYTALQSAYDVLWVMPVSPTSTIWAMNQAHCQYMDGLGYKRTGIVGGAAGLTPAQILANIQGLASEYTAYLANGVQGPNLQGQTVTFAPYLAAAQLAGLASGLALNQSLTLKAVNATGLEQSFAPSVIDQLTQGGAIVLKAVNGQYLVVKGQTTAAINPQATVDQIQWQVVSEIAVLEYGLNQVLSAFVGQPITSTTAAQVQKAVYHYLYTQATGSAALLAQAPAVSAIQVTITGTVISVQAPASPVVAADFVVTTLYAQQDVAQAA